MLCEHSVHGATPHGLTPRRLPCLQALAIHERLLRPEHPDTLVLRSNMLAWRWDMHVGTWQPAVAEVRANMAARERVLGIDHPSVLASMGNLAVCLHDVGELDEAALYAAWVHKARLRVLGPGHPDTIISMCNLATCLQDSGRLQASAA